MKRVPIFRPGKHVAASGAALEFTEANLAATIAAYDPAVHEAPIVVGHPKDNGPAYGWVTGLAFADGEMHADLGQVDPAFAEMVQAGRFKKRSASFYSPTSPSNPVPGVFYLRHVGFLGAQPPAIKGLKDPSFGENEEGIVEFADDAFAMSVTARILRGLRDTLLAKWGQDDTEKALPAHLVESLEDEARRARDTPPEATASMPAFTEPKTGDTPVTLTAEQIAELQAKAARVDVLETQNAEFAEREKVAKHAARVADAKTKLNALAAAGKVLPAFVPQLAEFAARLDEATEVVEFGEADKPRSQAALFWAELEARPKAIDFTERAAGDPNGATPPMDAKQRAEKVRAHRDAEAAKGNHLSFTEASAAVDAQTA